MAKANGVINAAASGITTRAHHPYFHDVNPIKRQSLTQEDKREAYKTWQQIWKAAKEREKKHPIIYPV